MTTIVCIFTLYVSGHTYRVAKMIKYGTFMAFGCAKFDDPRCSL